MFLSPSCKGIPPPYGSVPQHYKSIPPPYGSIPQYYKSIPPPYGSIPQVCGSIPTYNIYAVTDKKRLVSQ
ncbi:hypothetical protein [Bergeyella porcorum]|uniref:hypothetical protein n=1 Tax=Bergeyella porcorum TaxID=1735111 RepID=UPI002E1DB8FC